MTKTWHKCDDMPAGKIIEYVEKYHWQWMLFSYKNEPINVKYCPFCGLKLDGESGSGEVETN